MKFSMLSAFHGNSTKQGRRGSAFLLSMMLCSPVISAAEAAGVDTQQDTQQGTQQRQTSLQNKPLSGLDLLERAYANSENNPALAAKLATAYIQLARDKSDPAYYRKANSVLQPWAKKPAIPGVRSKTPEIPDELRLIRATLAQHDHHYREASEDLLYIVSKQPKNVQAWLTLSTIQLVQGNYPQAEVSCSALARISSHWLSSLCYSQLYSFTGSAERAYDLQQNLLAQLRSDQTELRVWVTGLLAETAMRLGRAQQAEQHFRDGLTIKPNDIYIMRAYSDFLLTRQRPAEVITLLKHQQQSDQLLLRLAIAVKHSADQEWQQRLVTELDSRFAGATATHGHTHDRDAALFLLEFKDDHEQAFRLAKLNWQTQKEPDDALLLLRTARAAQQTETIQQVRDWITTHQLQDVRL